MSMEENSVQQAPCGCGTGTRTLLPQQVEDGCTNIVSQEVCTEAVVTITPTVTTGMPIVRCVGLPNVGRTCEDLGFTPSTTVPGSCTTTYSQVICVSTPLTFDADVLAVPGEVGCGQAFNRPNCPVTTNCTLTIGGFANRQELTNQLITNAGGSIILGIDAQGLSLVATTANASAILLGNAPIPPTPADPPLRGQYQILYAQLLAANLNVLNGATCSFATNAIAAANTFLANSPAEGMDGAPAFTTLLTTFNEGNAPGCPPHCTG